MNTETPEPKETSTARAPLANISPVGFVFMTLAVVFFLYQIVGGSLAYFFLGEDLSAGGNMNLLRVVLSFGQFMFILAPAIVLAILRGDKLKETFRLNSPGIAVFLLSLLGIIIIQPFLQAFVYFQNELIFSIPGSEFVKTLKDLFDSLEETTMGLVKAGSLPEFFMVLFVIAVTPAISEEFLFRGLVFHNFEKAMSPAPAMFFAGSLFALFHFHPFNLVPLVILGIYLTYVTYESNSLYTAIACHFLNNFISAGAVYIYGTESFGSESMSADDKIYYAVAGVASAILFWILLKTIRRISGSQNKHNDTGGQ
ncbi:MAG: CPBP family intramembrane metalloprotease [Ignavibacteria bacterium]|nr:CPBP family intramembrane metalloprotease [Ignavibacteria bacterium]